MFQVKICGVTSIADARMIAEAGADAVGLNCYQESPRFVDSKTAALIAADLPSSVTKVGVFVNSSADEINSLASSIGLDMVQLHGDESAELAAQLDTDVIRAIRCCDGWRDQLEQYLRRDASRSSSTMAVLLDAYQRGKFGGTGATLEWGAVGGVTQLPVILAGGLNPSNVGYAVKLARPSAVDTASGVESAPGRKDRKLVREFVQNAKAALRDV